MKKKTINDILNELGFTEKEKIGFTKCIGYVKEEQQSGEIDAGNLIMNEIKEVAGDEI